MRPTNRAKPLIGKGASVGKIANPTDPLAANIFIGSTVADGIAGTIGRRIDIQLTLAEAKHNHETLGRVIEDVEFHLSGGK